MGWGRHIFIGFALMSVAACTTAVEQSESIGPITLSSVSVDMSNAAVVGRELPVSRASAEDVLENAIVSAVAPNNDPNGTPVDLNVVMTEVRLAPPLERVIAGTSSATGTLTVTNAETGDRLSGPVTVTGNTENLRAAGIIALATTVTPEEDYRGTVSGFAEVIRQTLFGSKD